MIGPYRLEREIARGGMGIVYLAHDTRLNRAAAIKALPDEVALNPDQLARFKQEAQHLASLNHPNIAGIYGLEESGGRRYLALEHVEGETLADRIARGPLPIGETVDICLQIAAGIEAAHEGGIIHRDMKPGNVMITPGDLVKVLDFGLAKGTVARDQENVADDSPTLTASPATMPGIILGTARYLSPEQARGKVVDRRTDIWSFGCVLYECLTAKHVFQGETVPDTIASILQRDPDWSLLPKGIPSRIEELLRRCLEKDPKKRLRDIGEARFALENLKSVGIGSAPVAVAVPAGRDRRDGSRRPNSYLIALTSTLALVFIAALGGRIFFGRHQGAQAGEPRLAILYFENVTEPGDPQRLGEMVTNLLITDLSESRYVTVVSSQRLYDILRKLGKEGARVIDRGTATGVAREAGAHRMLVGNIMRAGAEVEITSQLVDVASGESRASQQIRGAVGESMFALVDRLSAEVKKDLELPLGAKLERDVSLADVTTRSTEAYRYYLEGREYLYRWKAPQAVESFKKAVELDSTFAMAWAMLASSWARESAGLTPEESKRAMTRAVAHSKSATRREARYIATLAKYLAGDLAGATGGLEGLVREFPDEKAYYWDLHSDYMELGRGIASSPETRLGMAQLEKIIAIDPRDKAAYADLSYHCQTFGERERAIWAINQAIHLAPKDASIYHVRGRLYGLDGQIEKARESFLKSVELDPAFGNSWIKLGTVYVVMGDEARARECWDRALTLDAATRASARYLLAGAQVYRGRWGEALKAYQEAIVSDQRDESRAWSFKWKHFQVGALYSERGDWQRAAASFRRARDVGDAQIAPILGLSIVQLASGGPSWVKADVESLRALKRADSGVMYAIARSWVEMAHGRYNQAVAAIDSVPDFAFPFWASYTKGMAYLRAGRYKESVEKLEYCRDVFDPWKNELPQNAVRVHYYLGQAYEGSGEPAKAIKEYEKFTALWKDADPVFMGQVDDARRRLAKLRAQSPRAMDSRPPTS